MSRIARFTLALAMLASIAALARPALATEYVFASGVAMPNGGDTERVWMAGARHLMPGGLLGEVSAARVAGGAGVWAVAYARPALGMRAGAGVLALHSPDRVTPSRAAPVAGTGFQLAYGVQVPVDVEAGIGVDLDARYVFFARPEGRAAPDRFATRYWTFTLGITLLGER